METVVSKRHLSSLCTSLHRQIEPMCEIYKPWAMWESMWGPRTASSWTLLLIHIDCLFSIPCHMHWRPNLTWHSHTWMRLGLVSHGGVDAFGFHQHFYIVLSFTLTSQDKDLQRCHRIPETKEQCRRKEIRNLQLEASPPKHVHDSNPLWKFLASWAITEVYNVCGDGRCVQSPLQGWRQVLLSDGVGWKWEPKTHIVETSCALFSNVTMTRSLWDAISIA